MSSTLLRVAQENRSVVAVVGKGHLHGIKEHWQQPIDVSHSSILNLLCINYRWGSFSMLVCFQVEKLMEMPTHKPFITFKRIMGTLGVGVAAGAIFGGFFLLRKNSL